jgi:hypothetical protein
MRSPQILFALLLDLLLLHACQESPPGGARLSRAPEPPPRPRPTVAASQPAGLPTTQPVGELQVPVMRESGKRHYDEKLLAAIREAPRGPGGKERPGVRVVVGRGAMPLPGKRAPRLTLDTSQQVIRLDLEERGQGESLERSVYYLGSMGGYGAAGMLALKAKQFDDGLYAAVELASNRGAGSFPGRRRFLEELAAVLEKGALSDVDGSLPAAAAVRAALELDGRKAPGSATVVRAAAALRSELASDPTQPLKPLGFYTWSEELARTFQRDRLLQRELAPEAALAFARALSTRAPLLAAYHASLRLPEGLTNPLAKRDLRAVVLELQAGKKPELKRGDKRAFWPPSRSHESELVKKLYGDRPIPEGFSLIEEMIRRIQAGKLSLRPEASSGWYDHQVWALEALVAPERTPEAKRLELVEPYRQALLDLFRALYAATRETHVKQAEEPAAGGAPEVIVSPGLSVEPLATYYLRRAESYRFVRGVLERAFGQAALKALNRLTPAGPINLSLDEELALLQGIFHGAYLTVCDELGTKPERGSLGPASDRAVYRAWVEAPARDPDMFQDVRAMVPIFYDVQRRKMKVWAILGLKKRSLKASFARRPEIKAVHDGNGKPAAKGSVTPVWTDEHHPFVEIVSAEVYVGRLLDRTEFRAHCDRHKTRKAILENLP